MQPTDRHNTACDRLAESVVGGDKPDCQQNGNAAGGLTTILFAVLLALAGVLGSAARSTEIKARSNSVVACVTLEAVRAQGVLDDVGFRRVVRSLTVESNPYRDEFPASYREFMEACAALRAPRDPQPLADRAHGTSND